jgi:hypothetical protein
VPVFVAGAPAAGFFGFVRHRAVFMRPAHKLAGRACLLITPACGVFAPLTQAQEREADRLRNSGRVFVVVRELGDLTDALATLEALEGS